MNYPAGYIRHQIDYLNRAYQQSSKAYGEGKFSIGTSYGKKRLVFVDENTGQRDVSPTGTRSEVGLFIEGMTKALRYFA